jgi:carboxylesterase
LLPFVAAGAAALATWIVRRRLRTWFEEDFARRRKIGSDGIVVGAQPIELAASDSHAVLLIHGFNDTPQSVAYLAKSLHSKGWTVRAPLLPSHGRHPREAAAARAESWLSFARAQYEEMSRRYAHVAVCGQSMGGALSVLLAAKHPDMPALVLLAPYLGMPHGLQFKLVGAWVAQAAVPYRRNVGGERSIHDPEARARSLGTGLLTAGMLSQLRRIAAKAARDLKRVRVPTLYLQSREDNRITVADAERYFGEIGSATKEQRWLTDCGHIIADDYCRDDVAQQVHAWLERHAGKPL